jgi:hypothetical protein
MLKSQSILRAQPGDRLVIKGHHVGELERDAEVLEVLGQHGGPPFLVRWADDGRVSRLYPSSDAYVQHFEHKRPTRKSGKRGRANEARAIAAEWEDVVPPMDS